MSLQINESKITRVLLADGWHDCQGFGLDAYEFGTYHRAQGYTSGFDFTVSHGGGQSGVCATGFTFNDESTGTQVAGPLTAILAVAGSGITDTPV